MATHPADPLLPLWNAITLRFHHTPLNVASIITFGVETHFSPSDHLLHRSEYSLPPYARSAAMIPDKNIPSNVPAPPMLAIGAPRSAILPRLRRSAPIRVPSVPLT